MVLPRVGHSGSDRITQSPQDSQNVKSTAQERASAPGAKDTLASAASAENKDFCTSLCDGVASLCKKIGECFKKIFSCCFTQKSEKPSGNSNAASSVSSSSVANSGSASSLGSPRDASQLTLESASSSSVANSAPESPEQSSAGDTSRGLTAEQTQVFKQALNDVFSTFKEGFEGAGKVVKGKIEEKAQALKLQDDDRHISDEASLSGAEADEEVSEGEGSDVEKPVANGQLIIVVTPATTPNTDANSVKTKESSSTVKGSDQLAEPKTDANSVTTEAPSSTVEGGNQPADPKIETPTEEKKPEDLIAAP